MHNKPDSPLCHPATGRGFKPQKHRNNMKKYIVPQIQIVNLNIESALMGTSSPDNVYNEFLEEGEFSNNAGWSSDNWSSCKD